MSEAPSLSCVYSKYCVSMYHFNPSFTSFHLYCITHCNICRDTGRHPFTSILEWERAAEHES